MGRFNLFRNIDFSSDWRFGGSIVDGFQKEAKEMSYDLLISQKKDELARFLVDKTIIKIPFLEFNFDGTFVSIPFLKNHYNLIFAYRRLTEALESISDFEFTDPQTNLRFSQNNKELLTEEYFFGCAKKYMEIGTKSISEKNLLGVKFEILQILTDDTLQRPYFKARAREKFKANFPVPQLMVNLEKQDFKINYSWVDFVDQVFPTNLKIDLINFSFWDKKEEKVREIKLFNWDDLKAKIPEPEKITDEILGERLLFKGLNQNGSNYEAILRNLDKTELPESYVLDKTLTSVYSIV